MNDLDKTNTTKIAKLFSPTDHLANERTFLAWIRTNLGIMAFGFVVEKFSFFVQQIAFYLGNAELLKPNASHSPWKGATSAFGITLVGMGALFCILSFIKYKKTEKLINQGAYHSSNTLNTLIALLVFFVGVFLIFYLLESHSLLLNSLSFISLSAWNQS